MCVVCLLPDSSVPLQIPVRRWKPGEVGLFSQVMNDGTRGNSLQLHQGRSRLDMSKNFFTKSVVKLWIRMPREVMESPYLEVFEICADMTLGDVLD